MQGRGNSSGKIEDGEASCGCSFGKALIGTHKVPLRRTLLAPGQGSGELEAVSRSQFVNVQKAPGQIAHMVTGKDLSPSATQ
ncbi:MAG: hypothetical protein DMG89_13680 [Acidobacteria bacterium]|nr:MAG: hypothetical protein DMG89_13680 [Acidobacteriota bacterium]